MAGSKISQESIKSNWRVLCEDIGERLAGTDQEHSAAQYILEKFKEAGCAHCHLESFPCRSRQGASVNVQVDFGGGWQDVEAAAVTGSSSTDGVVEGDAVWFEMPENAPRLKPGLLKSKIAVLFGPLPEIVEHHIKLVEAAPLAVVHVDHRLPFSWAKNDGTYPLWVKKYGFPATVTVPFNEAWHWRQKEKIRLRVRSEMKMVDSRSDNVVAELPGTDPDLGIVLLGAHHDSQAGNVGADDNASGVVCLLELARLLRGLRHKRTIRFVSFGTEEQLSVGSAYYVKQHRNELDGIDLMINFDSVASPLGHHEMFCTGGPDLVNYAARYLEKQNMFVSVKREAVPFADHFPFTVFEVPALWFFRENFPGGRWQHHSVHDNLQNVSIKIITELISAIYRLIAEVVMNEKLPYGRELDPDLREQTLTYAKTLYDFSV